MAEQQVKDVGIVVFSADNYGSAATNIALYKAVEKLGYAPVILDSLAAPSGVSDRFFKRHLNVSSAQAEAGDYAWANEHCDAFVVGSDQSWRWSFPRFLNNSEYFLLAFAEDAKRKVAYAPSFGQESYRLDADIASMFKNLLPRFDAISVREDYAVTMCQKLFGINAEQVLDPVFLIDADDYRAIAALSELKLPEKYLIAYILEFSEAKYELAKKLAERNGLELIIVCDAFYYEKKRKAAGKPEIVDKPELVDWLAYLSHASMVMTDSFHGACFSLILEKPAAIVKARAKNRFDSLSKMFEHCEEDSRPVFFDAVVDAQVAEETMAGIDSAKVAAELRRARQGSLDWLSRALQGTGGSGGVAPQDMRVEYARLARRVAGYKGTIAEYAYEGELMKARDEKVAEGATYLQAQAMVVSQEEPPARTFAQQSKLAAYFEELKSYRNYTVLLSCKDDCSVSWPKFIERSKLPLARSLPGHSSYIAIVHAGANVYERHSKSPIDMRFRLDLGSGTLLPAFAGRCSKAPAKRGRSPLQILRSQNQEQEPAVVSVRMVSYRWDKETKSQVGRILIDNVDYSMNRRGINVVVIDNEAGAVVDSFSIDLHKRNNLTIERQ